MLEGRETHSGNIVLVKVAFLDGFTMVSLWIGKAKQSLLEEVTAFC
jgi:hypothetical protein